MEEVSQSDLVDQLRELHRLVSQRRELLREPWKAQAAQRIHHITSEIAACSRVVLDGEVDTALQNYSEQENIPLMAARLRCDPHLGDERREALENDLSRHLAYLDIYELMRDQDESAIAEQVTIMRELYFAGYGDFLAMIKTLNTTNHSTYGGFDPTKPYTLKHLGEWRKVRRHEPRVTDEVAKNFVFQCAYPEAARYIESVFQRDHLEGIRLVRVLLRALAIYHQVNETLHDSLRRLYDDLFAEQMNCDEKSAIVQAVCLSMNAVLLDSCLIEGHASVLPFGDHDEIVVDTYNGMLRSRKEFLNKEGWQTEHKGPTSYFYSSQRQLAPKYNEDGRLEDCEEDSSLTDFTSQYRLLLCVLLADASHRRALGFRDEAEAVYRFALQIDPEAEFVHRRHMDLLQYHPPGNMDGFYQKLLYMMEHYPDDISFKYTYAYLLLNKGYQDFPEAEKLFRTIQDQLTPASRRDFWMEFYYRKGDKAKAHELHREFLCDNEKGRKPLFHWPLWCRLWYRQSNRGY